MSAIHCVKEAYRRGGPCMLQVLITPVRTTGWLMHFCFGSPLESLPQCGAHRPESTVLTYIRVVSACGSAARRRTEPSQPGLALGPWQRPSRQAHL